MIGLAGDSHGRGNTHKDQDGGHQKAAANAKQAGNEPHNHTQPDQ